MIDEEQAYEIASDLTGRSNDDPNAPWRLIEFPQGWLIDEMSYKGPTFIGSLGRVIEKEPGRILRFPSSVPTDRILEEYDQVVARARVLKR